MMVRSNPASREMSDERLQRQMRDAFDLICYCYYDEARGYRVSSVRLMAAELEAA
jgi:hypothetical protein